jgi:hypothetical protein
VVGTTGSGKSSIVGKYTGQPVQVGDRPESVTRFCQLYPGRQDIFLCTNRLGLGLDLGLGLGLGLLHCTLYYSVPADCSVPVLIILLDLLLYNCPSFIAFLTQISL